MRAPEVYRPNPATPLQQKQGAGTGIQRYLLYRSGGFTYGNLTPAGKDAIPSAKKRGLSCVKNPVNILGTKAVIIETDNLGSELEAEDNGGPKGDHVSIKPKDDGDSAKLIAWANTKATAQGIDRALQKDVDASKAGLHAYTVAVHAAVTGTYKKK
jgi:hypothetical protein